jgi:SulP family sulfate permease
MQDTYQPSAVESATQAEWVSKDVYRVLFRSGTVETIGRDNIFMGSPRNPNLSTRNALKRAQQLLGTSEAEIQILFQPDPP